MQHLAVTGRIGSGKSFICNIFEEDFHIPVFYSDKEAKKCYDEPDIKEAVCQAFGTQILHPDGSFNWQAIGEMVFRDNSRLKQLNTIIHPRVMANYQVWKTRQQAPYTLFESAILYEQHLESLFDAVIYIQCPTEVVMERVRQRNGWDNETVTRRLQQQQLQDNCAEKADFLILHDSQSPLAESKQRLLPQLLRIHRQLASN